MTPEALRQRIETVLLDSDADRNWTITVEGQRQRLSRPYDLHTALDIASQYVEERFGVADVQWSRTPQGAFFVAKWETP